MSNCEKYLDMISAYADCELDAAEIEELEAHLESCSECRSILETYREISAEFTADTEDVPENFSAGVMDKVASYERNITQRSRRKVLRITGRWVGAAACIAIILFAFPRMPGLGCGASSMDAADTSVAIGGDFDGSKTESFNTSAGSAAEDINISYSDSTTDTATGDIGENIADAGVEESAGEDDAAYEVGMIVTVYGGDIPEMLIPLEGTLNDEGDIEYHVPVSVAEEIAEKYEDVEVERLDTDIDAMTALVIIKK